MRSSKSRSRNKSNRNRSVGNVVNRVFDSSGPEGKVRGTPQQVIDKYNQLARDAQLSGDRVAAENFQQHAEHYLRLLGSAQKEQEAKREEQERINRERQAERDRERARRQERELNNGEQPSEGQGETSSDVLNTEEDASESGLVQTPESQGGEGAPHSEKPKRGRKPRGQKKPEGSDQGAHESGGKPDPKEAAE